MTVIQSAQQIVSGESAFWVIYSENHYFQLSFSLWLESRGHIFWEEPDSLLVHVPEGKEVHNPYYSYRTFSRKKIIPLQVPV